MKMINIPLLLTVIFLSCEKSSCPPQGIIIDEGEIICEVSFEFDYSATMQEYVIINSTENIIGAKIKIENQASFDTINFNQYSLLGKRINFNSGGIIKRRAVITDSLNKRVNCTIEKESCGKDKVGLSKHTWMLTNKIPDDYEVVFNVIEK